MTNQKYEDSRQYYIDYYKFKIKASLIVLAIASLIVQALVLLLFLTFGDFCLMDLLK